MLRRVRRLNFFLPFLFSELPPYPALVSDITYGMDVRVKQLIPPLSLPQQVAIVPGLREV